MSTRLLTSCLLTLVLATGCDPTFREQLGRVQQEIVDGSLSGHDEDMVVELFGLDTRSLVIELLRDAGRPTW